MEVALLAVVNAAETSAGGLVVYSGAASVPPLPCPVVGKLHVASVTSLPTQVDGGAGLELTASVSVPLLPVSVVELINRLFVVSTYVPLLAAVTEIAIVQVPYPATVILENEADVAPTVREAGEGAAPQLV